jgi:transcriptional regulator with XRE-family HTH domain
MHAREIVREARQRAGLSQRLLAQRAGTSHSTLAAYETGAKVPTLHTLLRVVEGAGFRLEMRVAAVAPFDDRRERGAELARVLELAELFPAKHDDELAYPLLAAHVR